MINIQDCIDSDTKLLCAAQHWNCTWFFTFSFGFLKENDSLNVAEICSGQQDDQKILKHMSSSTQFRGRLCWQRKKRDEQKMLTYNRMHE